MRTTLVFAGLVASSIAQTTSLFLPGFDVNQGLLGSVVTSDAAATVYSIVCAPEVISTSCGVPTSFSLTQGPATGHYIYSKTQSFTLDVSCSFTGMAEGTCTAHYTSGNSFSAVSTTTVSGAEFTGLFHQIVLTTSFPTAGATTSPTGTLSTLAVTSSASSSVSNTTSAILTSTGTPTSTGTGISNSTGDGTTSSLGRGTGTTMAPGLGPSTTSGSPSISKASTAGMPKVTGSTGWVLGGLGVAVAVAAVGL